MGFTNEAFRRGSIYDKMNVLVRVSQDIPSIPLHTLREVQIFGNRVTDVSRKSHITLPPDRHLVREVVLLRQVVQILKRPSPHTNLKSDHLALVVLGRSSEKILLPRFRFIPSHNHFMPRSQGSSNAVLGSLVRLVSTHERIDECLRVSVEHSQITNGTSFW